MHETDTPGEIFSRRVRQLRSRLGMSQAELAKRANQYPGVVDLDQSKIARIEAVAGGKRRPVSLEEAAALANVLGSMIDSMLVPDVGIDEEIKRLKVYLSDCGVAYANARRMAEKTERHLNGLIETHRC